MRIEAGEDLDVVAQSLLRHRQLAGTGQAGLLGAEVSRGSRSIQSFVGPGRDVQQFVGGHSQSYRFCHYFWHYRPDDREAFAGTANGLFGLGAQVVLINDHSSSQAKIGSNSAISA